MINFPKRYLILLSIAVCLIIVGVVVFWPTSEKELLQQAIKRYQLPLEPTREDIIQMVDKMRNDDEFYFYFQVLDRSQQDLLTEKAADIILASKEISYLLEQIQVVRDKISSLGATFLYLEFPEGFAQRPQDFPGLNEAFWSFIKEEFKLTVLGVYYKVQFDPQFAFVWDRDSILAAQRLREIWGKRQGYLKAQQR